MIVVVCPNCLRALDPLEFGIGLWQNEQGKEITCRHCDAKLVVAGDDVKLIGNDLSQSSNSACGDSE